MTKRLSETDKALLKVKREREREEARNVKHDQRESEKAEVTFWDKVYADNPYEVPPSIMNTLFRSKKRIDESKIPF